MKQKILGTGLSGMVGSRIVELLANEYEFEDLSLATGVDITQHDLVIERVVRSSADWILHLAAKADVEACEQDKAFGINGSAWQINVEATRNIVSAASQIKKKIIYISTDFVFDGTKDIYTEIDNPHPINWYAQTKYEGEKLVMEDSGHVVMRIAYTYRSKFNPKKDFFRSILQKLSTGNKVIALEDHIITPTFIDDIARAVGEIIKLNCNGIFHVVGSEFLTPFQAAHKIAEEFELSSELIMPVLMNDYFKNQAPRPFKLRLKNDRIKDLGISMNTFSQGIHQVKEQGVKI